MCKASSVALETPEVEIIAVHTSESMRTIQMILSSPRGAPVITLDVKPYQAVQAVIIDGKRLRARTPMKNCGA